jgi:hypothetical protein
VAETTLPVAETEAVPRSTGSLDALPIEPRTAPRVAAAPPRSLRLPEEHDPAPRQAKMLVLSAWAAVLVLVGFVVAIRVVAEILLNDGPDWLVPTTFAIGTTGVVAAGFAFAAIHKPLWSYAALGASTAFLATNLALILTYL